MRVRTPDNLAARTDSLIERIEAAGYAVSVHRLCEYVEIHAVPLDDPYQQYLARVADGDDDGHFYRCALELARMVGIT